MVQRGDFGLRARISPLLDGALDGGDAGTATAAVLALPLLLVVLSIDPRSPRTPQLPDRRLGALTQFAASVALHVAAVVMAVSVRVALVPAVEHHRSERLADPYVRHIVFVAPDMPRPGGGGGGGGNRQSGPIRRAQGIGSDKMTVRVEKPPLPAPAATAPPALVADVPLLPSLVLDAKSTASGLFNQIGLPVGGVLTSTSTGSGSGGGVGTSVGTGIGSGRGPGLGPGSGGGTGGGVYRPGGAISAPRLITEVKPKYTDAALRQRIQGTVVLEVVVTSDGCTSGIRVVRSLDRGGLDEEAVLAVAQWRFEPGRLAGAPVDVLVTVMLDFTIR